MGRARTPAPPQQQEEAPNAPPPDPLAVASIAAALAAGANLGAAALPLIGQAILTAEAAELGLEWAKEAGTVAALIAGLALPGLPSVPSVAPAPTRITVRTRVTPDERPEAAPHGLARAGYAREYLNRARYLRAAFKRGAEAYRDGDHSKRGVWWQKERYWHGLHVEAMRARERARVAADREARLWGAILGWYGIDDASTTLDCREVLGKNFDVRRPPARGIPGTVHGKCRCWAGPPHAGAEVIA